MCVHVHVRARACARACARVCATRTKVGYTCIYDRICENRPLRVIQIVQYSRLQFHLNIAYRVLDTAYCDMGSAMYMFAGQARARQTLNLYPSSI